MSTSNRFLFERWDFVINKSPHHPLNVKMPPHKRWSDQLGVRILVYFNGHRIPLSIQHIPPWQKARWNDRNTHDLFTSDESQNETACRSGSQDTESQGTAGVYAFLQPIDSLQVSATKNNPQPGLICRCPRPMFLVVHDFDQAVCPCIQKFDRTALSAVLYRYRTG